MHVQNLLGHPVVTQVNNTATATSLGIAIGIQLYFFGLVVIDYYSSFFIFKLLTQCLLCLVSICLYCQLATNFVCA